MRLSAGGKYSVAVVEAGSFYQTAGNVTEIPAYESEFLEVPLTVEWGINTKPQAVCCPQTRFGSSAHITPLKANRWPFS